MTRGNLIEVAVGLIMALATFALVQALVADLITPIIAAIVGEPSFEDLTFTINDSEFRYGDFINAAITFSIDRRRGVLLRRCAVSGVPAPPGSRPRRAPARECTTEIPIAAKRCPSCTAQVPAAA